MIQIINSILCGATFLLTFIIFVNPNKVNTKANQWFGAFVFCIFLILFENILLSPELLNENDFAFEFISLSSFVIAPIFYLSVSYYVKPIKKWKNKDYLHFIFALSMLILITLSHLIDSKESSQVITPETVASAGLIFNICFSLQVIPYSIVAYKKIMKHQKNIQFLNSSTENIDLKWLKHISISVIIISLFWVFDIVFKMSDKSTKFEFISSLTYLLAIFYITYFWQNQKEIFPYNLIEKEEIDIIIIESAMPEDNRKKLLTDEKLEKLKIELLELLNAKKPFLDDDLSLVKLASFLNISTHLLSYVINKGFDENFYKFINRYRIEEAKELILDSRMNHLSLLGIGFEVGFNSKTVFNTTFKKMTGQTPSEFKKQNAQKIGSDL